MEKHYLGGLSLPSHFILGTLTQQPPQAVELKLYHLSLTLI